MVANPSITHEEFVWLHLLEQLAEWDPNWRERAGLDEVKPPPRAAGRGGPISNREAFEAFALALLSGNTRWDKIAAVRAQLSEPFMDFEPARFSALTETEIDRNVLPWFRERGAGAAGLRGGLLRLRQTALMLAGKGAYRSAEEFITAGMVQAHGSPEHLAVLLGSHKEWKLPGFGIALAAEALRFLGFDLCKPDRHVLRALGSWHLVEFARWNRKGPFTAPDARPNELLSTMLVVREIAEVNRVPVTYANSVIWFAGAVSGARFTNAKLEASLRPV